jgi:hypothetical protein
MITIDTRDMIKTLQREYWGLKSKEKDKATARAINDALAQGRTAAKQGIREKYNIPAANLKNSLMPVKSASPANLGGTLSISNKPISMSAFKPKKDADGISIEVKKGDRKTVPGAFFIPRAKKTVFARAYVMGGNPYLDGQFMFRAKRVRKKGNDLPIGKMMSVSPSHAQRSEAVNPAITERIESAFARRLEHHLNRALFKK